MRVTLGVVLALTWVLVSCGLAAAGTGEQHVLFPAYELGRSAPPTAAAVGDVDGDGTADTGAVFPTRDGVPADAWIVPTPAVLPATTDLATTPEAALHVVGDDFAPQLTGLGDVDGDGRADVALVGRLGVSVVFGRGSGVVDVSQPGPWGFRIAGLGAGAHGETGSSCCGRVALTQALADAGDQNGDGVHDLAVAHDGGVTVVFTPPLPAGRVLDGAAPGAAGFVLRFPGSGAHVIALGDLDGDARGELAVGWEEPGDSPRTVLAGVLSPAPGAVLDVADAVAAGRAWRLEAYGTGLITLAAAGDRDDDGRLDLAATLASRGGVLIGQPELGTTGLVDAHRLTDTASLTGSVAVGDQDADGLTDLAAGSEVHVTGPDAGQARRLACPWRPPSGVFTSGDERSIVAGVPDRSGDGRPELVALVIDTWAGLGSGRARSAWRLDVCRTPGPPIPDGPPTASRAGDGIDFSAVFQVDSFDDGGRGIQGALLLEGHEHEGPVAVTNQLLPVGPGRGLVFIHASAAELGAQDGRTYRYRIALSLDQFAVGPESTFTYRAAAPIPSPVRLRVRRGTARGDTLIGTPGADDLRGLAGDDVLRGGAGADRLDGGRDRDVIAGGDGNDRVLVRDGRRDRVDCGAGNDTVVADARDVVRGCEHVLRSR